VYSEGYRPYYDKYKGEEFVIVSDEHPEDDSGEHVFLRCVTNPYITVAGWVHRDDLVEENEDVY